MTHSLSSFLYPSQIGFCFHECREIVLFQIANDLFLEGQIQSPGFNRTIYSGAFVLKLSNLKESMFYFRLSYDDNNGRTPKQWT